MKTRRNFLKLLTGIMPLALLPTVSLTKPVESEWELNPRWNDSKFRMDAYNIHSRTVHSIKKFPVIVREYEPGWEQYLGRRFTVHRSFEMKPPPDYGKDHMKILQYRMGNFKKIEEAIKQANDFME